ncbi:MAG: [FeFe] hydrogenase H-cluster radical SAM maturase HydG [Candidatus Cloacimonadales bacterium]|jgi:2-iminoacetate synthase|nr:[FeFe] hydrogenase H-cluster radical SAM maturase HydG [Candidatus Cloacimonadota bacterium]MDD2649949.1 [FeFe] hydrogenase H-cluster radical SAM maturase HydG [Candidatus Cloacimonadota bacterium]MDD3501133.1 [FeFe] hydrogenase H-cluster radical SAM maturase HydG [Candidatus Cloacimonadota bacterium]MDX9977870.1 [FeFe] hydrogenase H-cluster radical SAM maturase HydG [Candidatus Cloacimonadales bacterium]
MEHNFINEKEIFESIENAQKADKAMINDILQKARELKGLSLTETAALLMTKDPEDIASIFETATWIKDEIYGNRIVLFAPLYVTNLCGNICDYCAFRADNKELERITLSKEQLIEETKIISDSGHKRALLVYGEHPSFKINNVIESIETVYAVKHNDEQAIRRININAAPMSVDDFKALKETGIGTYQCFQETYHYDTYKKVHLAGLKTNYEYRLHALHRAQKAGIDDVAVGVLFGLYEPIFEVLAMLQHCFELEREFDVGPHTVSFPRIEPALGSDMSIHPPYEIDDQLFKQIVAVTRLAIPYTGMIISTRENPKMRAELIDLGVSQISAGSKTSPGGYHEAKANIPRKQQFLIGDERSLDEVINDLIVRNKHMPSFCTSCYRKGRTGHKFMTLAKPGNIKNFCQPNAILTFMEYLQQFGSEETKINGIKLITDELATIENEILKAAVKEGLERLTAGETDIYF